VSDVFKGGVRWPEVSLCVEGLHLWLLGEDFLRIPQCPGRAAVPGLELIWEVVARRGIVGPGEFF